MKEVIKKGVCNRYPPQVSVSFMPVVSKIKGGAPDIKETTKGVSPPVRYDRPGCGEFKKREDISLDPKEVKVCGFCTHYISMVNPQEN